MSVAVAISYNLRLNKGIVCLNQHFLTIWLDFCQFLSKFNQFIILKTLKFLKDALKLLSYALSKYAEPLIAIWYGTKTVIYLDVVLWDEKSKFLLIFAQV